MWACLKLDLPLDDLFGPLTEDAIEFALSAMMQANPELDERWAATWKANLMAKCDPEDSEEEDQDGELEEDPFVMDIEFIHGYDCRRTKALPQEMFE